MKKLIMKISAIMAVLFGACSLFAADARPAQDIIKDLVENGESGDSSLVTNEDGSVKTIYIVGTAPLNKAASAAMAERFAARSAYLNAQRSLSELFNSRVEAKTTESGEMVFTEKGSAAGDEQGVGSSTSTAVSQISDAVKTYTKSAQSGLQKVRSNANRNGKYVVVCVWNIKRAKALAQASEIMAKNAAASVRASNELDKAIVEGAALNQKANAAINGKKEEAKKEVSAPLNKAKEGRFAAPKGNTKERIINVQDL